MSENVEFDSAPKFREKLETIKESYFPKTKIEEDLSKDEVDSVAMQWNSAKKQVRMCNCIYCRYFKKP